MNRTEFRHMIRRWTRRPGLTLAAVLTLALGIGAVVATFSVVYGILIRPLPYPDADRVVGLWHRAPGIGFDQLNQSYGTYMLYRERARSLEDIALYDVEPVNITGDGEPERLLGARVTASLFSVLGIVPVVGRPFGEEEDTLGGPDVVVIGHALWQRRFGGAPGVVGTRVLLDGKAREVVGVLPRGLRFPQDEVDLWIPHPIDPEELAEVNFSYDVVARLTPDASVASVGAELSALLPGLPDAYPGSFTKALLDQSQVTAYANPLRDDLVGDVRRLLWVVLAAVGFVLVIACANVANLLLARAEGRHREMAVRAALGASRGRLVRGLLVEGVALSLVGCMLGMVLAWLAIRGLAWADPGSLPRLHAVRLDGPVLLFALVVALVAGLAFGALPTLRLPGRVFGVRLTEGGRGGTVGRGGRRARGGLVVAQVALALVLLFGSALMMRTFQALRGVDPGFDRSSVLTLRLSLHGERYREPEARARFWTRLVDETRTIAGVAHAATVLNLPLTDGDTSPGYIIEDFPPQPDDLPLVARQNFVTDGYFEALGIPILRGRGIERRDIERRTPSVVVSAAFARRVWQTEDVIGKRLKRGLPSEQTAPWYDVVGIAGDVRDDDLAGDPVEMVYFPVLQQAADDSGWTAWSMSLAVRAAGSDPMALVGAVRDRVRDLDADLPMARMRTTAEIARTAMARTTFTMALLGLAAGVAVFLGSIGIYGVLANSVSQRTREIGVRLALGAAPKRVLGMLVGEGLRLVSIGLIIGAVGALLAGRVLASLLFGVAATDTTSFVAVLVVLVSVAVLACLIPARRAARIAPTEALRHQ